MPFVLRKIRRSRWRRDPHTGRLSDSGLRSARRDLCLPGESLSAYLVNYDKSNLERVITALAANSMSLDTVDYIMMDISLDIQTEATPGRTPDSEVNSFHLDLPGLSDSKLDRLAHAFRDKGESDRYAKKDLKQMILEAVRTGNIDRDPDKFRPDSSFWR